MKKPWLWNINKTEPEVKKILADPGHEAFIHYAALLFSRHTGLPREIFGAYIRKEDFCRHWAAIKRRMRKDKWNDARIPFWDGVQDYLVREFKKKGVVFPRGKKPLVRDPAREKVSAQIRERRRALKMTQAGLARRMGVSQQFIAKIESGTQNLSMETLRKIDRCLGASKHYEYSAEAPPAPAFRVTEPVTAWFTSSAGFKTVSR